MRNVIITGGSRGIGLEFAKQYLEKESTVIVGSRKPTNSNELLMLKEKYDDKLSIIQLDVGSKESRDNFIIDIDKLNLVPDILINNAGIASGNEKFRYKFGDLQEDDLLKSLHINSVAPLMVT
ncbi:MAG: SDR family NAD(P)-dependent oxidoreductase, partial [Candidatus Kariarchaeaceae archaeon]